MRQHSDPPGPTVAESDTQPIDVDRPRRARDEISASDSQTGPRPTPASPPSGVARHVELSAGSSAESPDGFWAGESLYDAGRAQPRVPAPALASAVLGERRRRLVQSREEAPAEHRFVAVLAVAAVAVIGLGVAAAIADRSSLVDTVLGTSPQAVGVASGGTQSAVVADGGSVADTGTLTSASPRPVERSVGGVSRGAARIAVPSRPTSTPSYFAAVTPHPTPAGSTASRTASLSPSAALSSSPRASTPASSPPVSSPSVSSSPHPSTPVSPSVSSPSVSSTPHPSTPVSPSVSSPSVSSPSASSPQRGSPTGSPSDALRPSDSPGGHSPGALTNPSL